MTAGVLGTIVAAATDDEFDALADALRDRLGAADPDALMSAAEAAEYLRCKPRRIYALRARGAIVALQDGRRPLFRRRELDRYLSDGPAA